MPPYLWLLEKTVDFQSIPGKVSAMRMLGVPYPDWTDEEVLAQVDSQAEQIVNDLKSNYRETEKDKQIVALIAYLQKLGAYEDVSTRTTAVSDN